MQLTKGERVVMVAEPGQADAKSFNRKGISGDWQNHFTPEHVAAFKRVAGERLRSLFYHSLPPIFPQASGSNMTVAKGGNAIVADIAPSGPLRASTAPPLPLPEPP